MKLSSREAGLGVLTGILVLFSLSYLLVAPRIKEWQERLDTRAALERRVVVARHLVEDRPRWDARMADLRARLTRYPAAMDVTADYLKILERVATESILSLIQRKPQKEKRHGDCFEMPIDCTWEGDLQALVRFLFSLEQEPTTMDIEELSASLVSGGQGRLKGSFTLMCIYSRDEPSPDAARESPAPADAGPETPPAEPADQPPPEPVPALPPGSE